MWLKNEKIFLQKCRKSHDKFLILHKNIIPGKKIWERKSFFKKKSYSKGLNYVTMMYRYIALIFFIDVTHNNLIIFGLI